MEFSPRVTFYISDDEEKLATLRAEAVRVDDENNGEHQKEYTVEQAFTVVWHGNPSFLVSEGICWGWTVNDGVFAGPIEMEEATA